MLQRSRKGELVANQGPELRAHLGEGHSYDADVNLEPGDGGGVEPGGGTTRDEDLSMLDPDDNTLRERWRGFKFVNCPPPSPQSVCLPLTRLT